MAGGAPHLIFICWRPPHFLACRRAQALASYFPAPYLFLRLVFRSGLKEIHLMASHVEVSNPRILAGRPLQPSKPTPNTMPETVPDSQYSEFGNKMRTFINLFLWTRKNICLVQKCFRPKGSFTGQIWPDSQKAFPFEKGFPVQKCHFPFKVTFWVHFNQIWSLLAPFTARSEIKFF